MAITDKKGINLASGFKLISPAPLDARYVVADETELQSIISSGAVYNGLIVWVNSLNKAKQYNGSEFVDIAGGISEERVNELIDNKLTQENGTAVPNSGLIEKVYINSRLTAQELYEMCDQLTYINYLGLTVYPIFVSSSMDKVLGIFKNDGGNYKTYLLSYFGGGVVIPEDLIRVGHKFDEGSYYFEEVINENRELEINDVNILEDNGTTLDSNYVNQNELIKNFVSLTELKKNNSIDVDNFLNDTSTNPVQNKVIYKKLQEIIQAQNLIDVVSSYEELQNKYGVEGEITSGFENGDKIKVLKDETRNNKPTYYVYDGTNWTFYKEEAVQDVTADNEVIEGSTNLVTSGAVARYVKKELKDYLAVALSSDY